MRSPNLVWLALAGLLVASPFLAAEAPKAKKLRPQRAAKTPQDSGRGMRVYRDPATGQIVPEPEGTSAAAPQARSAGRSSARTPAADAAPVLVLPNGAEAMATSREDTDFLVARRNPDGSVSIRHQGKKAGTVRRGGSRGQ